MATFRSTDDTPPLHGSPSPGDTRKEDGAPRPAAGLPSVTPHLQIQHQHPSPHHGPGVVESTPRAILPPELTPATTTRQSVALGVLDTIGSQTITTNNSSSDPTVPYSLTSGPSLDTSTPTSIPPGKRTQTLSDPQTTSSAFPSTQSAALRALNAPAFQSQLSTSNSKSAKSTSSQTTLSSQPVVVRTYSGPRNHSRPSSVTSTRLFPSMNGSSLPQGPSGLSSSLGAGQTERLPAVEDFSFSAILRAVDPEIRDAIDAIAEICARSRMSLADEYDAHLPPQGEIVNSNTMGAGRWSSMGMGALVGRGRAARIGAGQGWSATENTLTAVPEASSSSERLAGSVKSGRGKLKKTQSAYGSLKSALSGSSGKRQALDVDTFVPPTAEQVDDEATQKSKGTGTQWAVIGTSSSTDHPSIAIVTTPRASKYLSLDISSTINAGISSLPPSSQPDPKSEPVPDVNTPEPKSTPLHRRTTSALSTASSGFRIRPRSSTLSSIASWIPMPWGRPQTTDSDSAETKLKEMLKVAQTQGKGKDVMRA